MIKDLYVYEGLEPASYTKNREPNGALIASLRFSNFNIRSPSLPVKLAETCSEMRAQFVASFAVKSRDWI